MNKWLKLIAIILVSLLGCVFGVIEFGVRRFNVDWEKKWEEDPLATPLWEQK